MKYRVSEPISGCRMSILVADDIGKVWTRLGSYFKGYGIIFYVINILTDAKLTTT